MTVLADLEEFVSDHRTHRPMAGDATEPAWNGYFSRWRARVEWCLSGG
jgi:hypothetical protein